MSLDIYIYMEVNSQVTDDNIQESNMYAETFQRWLGRKLIIIEFVVESKMGV